MNKCALQFCLLCILMSGLFACSTTSNSGPPATSAAEETKSTSIPSPKGSDLTALFSRAWRVSPSPYGAAGGSLYVFFANGTLLETSCVETYRIATWTSDPKNPRVLQVIEDGRQAFSATFDEEADQSMLMRQTLAVGNHEAREVKLTGVDKEFACPDIRK